MGEKGKERKKEMREWREADKRENDGLRGGRDKRMQRSEEREEGSGGGWERGVKWFERGVFSTGVYWEELVKAYWELTGRIEPTI